MFNSITSFHVSKYSKMSSERKPSPIRFESFRHNTAPRLILPLDCEPPFDPACNRFNNVPLRYETLIALGPDERKVTLVPETRVPNAALFLFKKEDHTLANLLRAQLLADPRVLFAAYKVPHPLFSDFELRVQTDGTSSPRDVLVNACRDIVRQLEVLGREFTKEWELKKISKMHEANGI